MHPLPESMVRMACFQGSGVDVTVSSLMHGLLWNLCEGGTVFGSHGQEVLVVVLLENKEIFYEVSKCL